MPVEDGGITSEPAQVHINLRIDDGLQKGNWDLAVKYRGGQARAEAWTLLPEELSDEETAEAQSEADGVDNRADIENTRRTQDQG